MAVVLMFPQATRVGASGIDLMVNTISLVPPRLPVRDPIKALTRLFTNKKSLAGRETFLRCVGIEILTFCFDSLVQLLSILSVKCDNEWIASDLITVSSTSWESVLPPLKER